jgi:predicted Co/Zn/Cd cation transporter (cation efflux family)
MTTPNSDLQYEKRSLSVGMWANLLMGAAGITAAQLSNSDALMVDGLYSGVNFCSAIIAGRVASSLLKPADKRMPFGYDANEALYILFRSLVLLGILMFAGFNSLRKIITYVNGGDVPELQFGPIAIYMVFMVAICAGLAAGHHHNWSKTGRRSEILLTEKTASIVDCVISAGAGAALLSVTLLRGTPAEVIIPVADAVVVIVLALVMIKQPYKMLHGAVKEVAGEAVDEEISAKTRERIEQTIRDIPCELLAVAVTKLGRTHFVLTYVRPDDSVVAEDLDEFRNVVHACYEDLFGTVKSEVIYTAEKPF